MKTLKGLLSIVLVLASFFAQAQVTGNVKLGDTYGHLQSDHSGIMVVFHPESVGAVADTIYTNTNGDFSISNLAIGQYRALFYKQGYGAKDYPTGNNPSFFITTPNYTLPNQVLFKLPPVDTLTGHVSGLLSPFTHYVVYDTIDIPAGDTLVLPEGAWLDGNFITVDGVLELIGTDSFPAVLASLDSSYGGYAGNTGNITLNPGSKLLAQHGQILFNTIHANAATIDLSLSSSKIYIANVIDTLLYNDYEGDFDALNIDILQTNLTIDESDFAFGYLTSEIASRVQMNCSNIVGNLVFKSGSSCFMQNCVLRQDLSIPWSSTIYTYEADTFSAINNVFWPTGLSFANQIDTMVGIFTNNRFVDARFYSDSLNNLYLDNNLGLILKRFPNSTFAGNIKQAKYNFFYSDYGDNIFVPLGYLSPPGMVRVVLPSNISIDSTDTYNNRYVSDNTDIRMFDYYTGKLLPGADSVYHDTGDPTLFDYDGSRSDIGATYAGCLNPLVVQPDTSSPVTALNDSVWPGDANYDGLCDNNDLLPIGVKYGATGPVRPSASLVWTAQYCDPWGDSLANHRDIKHVDCNGDGTINYTDVNAIYQNYSLTHVVHKQQQQQFGNGLWLQFPSDSIFEGDTVEVKVMLGTTSQPVNNIYGLAFSISYDSAFIKPGSASMTYNPCWLGTDTTNMVSFFKELPNQTKYDLALCRTDHAAVSGGGQIGTLVVVINDDIQAKDSMTLTTQMDFSNILAIDQHENRKTLGENYGTMNVQVGYAHTTGLVANTEEVFNLAIYPNPAKNELHIVCNSSIKGEVSYNLYSLEGKPVAAGALAQNGATVDVSGLANGLYLLRCQTHDKVVYRKVMINR